MLVTRAQRKQHFVALIENRRNGDVLVWGGGFHVRDAPVTDGPVCAVVFPSRPQVWGG